MTRSDEALAQAAAKGEKAAFSELLERHYSRTFAFAFRLTGRRADAEDLTQDICAALPSKLMRFDGRSRFTTWLYRVVLNAAHDRHRRTQTHSRAAAGWGDWEIARHAEITETNDRLEWLTQTMRALPADLRDTLALTLDDLTHAEAAEVLGISEGTVSWRLSEARRHLRALKEQEDQA